MCTALRAVVIVADTMLHAKCLAWSTGVDKTTVRAPDMFTFPVTYSHNPCTHIQGQSPISHVCVYTFLKCD